jgi:hypothetical protein
VARCGCAVLRMQVTPDGWWFWGPLNCREVSFVPFRLAGATYPYMLVHVESGLLSAARTLCEAGGPRHH